MRLNISFPHFSESQIFLRVVVLPQAVVACQADFVVPVLAQPTSVACSHRRGHLPRPPCFLSVG